MTRLKFPSFALFTLMMCAQACSGGGSNTSDGEATTKTTYSLNADYINLLSAANSTQSTTMVDVYFKQGSNDNDQIVENLNYAQLVNTESFGWTGLPQANVTLITKDALNNQATLTTTNMTLNGSFADFFFLLTGAVSNPSSIKVMRLEKQIDDNRSYRFIHANPFYDGNIDIYDVASRQPIALNLAKYQTSRAINYDKNQAQTTIIIVPEGTIPNYNDTSGYLFQHRYDNQSLQQLHVLTADLTTTWQNFSYMD